MTRPSAGKRAGSLPGGTTGTLRPQMDRPTFLLLGAGKAGTTALPWYLGRHPDVLVSQPKEPNFFDTEYGRGLGYYWDTYYGAWNGKTAAGEARAINLLLPFVAERIRDCTPDARLIVTLRDPADRAFSHGGWSEVMVDGQKSWNRDTELCGRIAHQPGDTLQQRRIRG